MCTYLLVFRWIRPQAVRGHLLRLERFAFVRRADTRHRWHAHYILQKRIARKSARGEGRTGGFLSYTQTGHKMEHNYTEDPEVYWSQATVGGAGRTHVLRPVVVRESTTHPQEDEATVGGSSHFSKEEPLRKAAPKKKKSNPNIFTPILSMYSMECIHAPL